MTIHPRVGRWILLGVGLTAYGVILNYIDPMWLFIIVYVFGLWIVVPAVALATIILLTSVYLRWSSFRLPRSLLLVVAAVVFLAVAALPVNARLQDWAVDNAKSYPERIAPLLEQYRQQHGTYPVRLDELPPHPHPPRLLRTTYGYRTDGSSYSFSFPVPGGMIDEWNYSSEDRTWHLDT